MAIPTSTSSSTGLGPGGSGAALRYPKDIISNDTDYVRFDFYDYTSATPFGAGTVGGAVDAYNSSYNNLQTASGVKSVILYMPEDIGAEYGTSWGGKSFSNIGSAALKLLGNTANLDGPGVLQTIGGSLAEGAKGLAPAFIADQVAKKMNEIPGVGGGISTNDVLSGTKGIVLNPNAELMFDRAEMRTFGLSFKMVARNASESVEIKNIITTFKKASSPKYGGNGGTGDSANFMGVPNLVDVNFMRGSNLNEYVPQYKPCAITSVRVTYTPDGTYATYDTGAPVAIKLDLGFAETKLIFRDDIKDSGWSY